eukprot:scaffold95985_cov72-Phaeocystis_antarctica.AAC.2
MRFRACAAWTRRAVLAEIGVLKRGTIPGNRSGLQPVMWPTRQSGGPRRWAKPPCETPAPPPSAASETPPRGRPRAPRCTHRRGSAAAAWVCLGRSPPGVWWPQSKKRDGGRRQWRPASSAARLRGEPPAAPAAVRPRLPSSSAQTRTCDRPTWIAGTAPMEAEAARLCSQNRLAHCAPAGSRTRCTVARQRGRGAAW